MYPPMFFGSPCDFGPRGHHNGPFSHHYPPKGHQHHPMGPHPWSMGFDHHLKGPHHHRWGPYHAPRGPHHCQTRPASSKCPFRGPTVHSGPFGMRHRGPFGMGHPRPFGMGHPGPFGMGHPGPFGMGHPGPFGIGHPGPFGMGHQRPFGVWPMHLMAAADKLACLMLNASTDDEWINNTCSVEGCDECSDDENLSQSSPTHQQQTSGDEGNHDKDEHQRAKDCDAEKSDLWMNAEEGVWYTEVFIGPYAESEVTVLGEGQDGVKVEASHLHGENVVAVMMRRLPPPSGTSYTISHTFSRPFVTITATKSADGVHAAEHLLKEVNLADEAKDF